MNKRCWKKGALHTHSTWSDGRGLPEVAVKTFMDLGYDFMCLTDHNIFQQKNHSDLREIKGEEGSWPPSMTWKEIERSKRLLPDEIDLQLLGVRYFVRLKSFQELKKRFHRPGKFLLMPGVEITHMIAHDDCGGQSDWHANIVNLPEELIPAQATNSVESYSANFAQYKAAAARHPSYESLFVLNHPFWRLWDVSPLAALENPEIQFFEVCNGGGEATEEQPMMTTEKFWDFILAHRVDRGQQLLYAIASDDSHFYEPERIGLVSGCNHGWVMVDCPDSFTSNEVIRRMKQGEFYASCGVSLEDVVFDKETKMLTVSVKPEADIKYHIDFITTKRNFDRTIQMKEFPHSESRFNRRLPVIPENIGIVVQSTEKIEAAYTMQEDDLYVRAVVRSDIPYEFCNLPYAPQVKCAWTQPYK